MPPRGIRNQETLNQIGTEQSPLREEEKEDIESVPFPWILICYFSSRRFDRLKRDPIYILLYITCIYEEPTFNLMANVNISVWEVLDLKPE